MTGLKKLLPLTPATLTACARFDYHALSFELVADFVGAFEHFAHFDFIARLFRRESLRSDRVIFFDQGVIIKPALEPLFWVFLEEA